jgi:hypothetical protein
MGDPVGDIYLPAHPAAGAGKAAAAGLSPEPTHISKRQNRTPPRQDNRLPLSGPGISSLTGDPHGFVDEVLARDGLPRRVRSTVSNFMFACAIPVRDRVPCALPAGSPSSMQGLSASPFGTRHCRRASSSSMPSFPRRHSWTRASPGSLIAWIT